MKFLIVASFLFVSAIASPISPLVVLKAEDDGQWKGEGLLESQDWGQYDNKLVYAAGVPSIALAGAPALRLANPGLSLPLAGLPLAGLPALRLASPAVWSAGAPIGLDGRVVDTPEVAIAKAEHYAAKAAAVGSPLIGSPLIGAPLIAGPAPYAAWAPALWSGHGAAPIGLDGRVVDTPEVAIAKAEHFAAKAAASNIW